MMNQKYVCVDCGIKYLTEEQKKNSYATTFHVGKCCECGEEKDVTNIRHYNYLRDEKQRKSRSKG